MEKLGNLCPYFEIKYKLEKLRTVTFFKSLVMMMSS